MDVSPAQLSTLLFLALVDSTSVGTLVVPLWLLLAPGATRVGRMAVYLGTVATFYLGVGLLLLAGVDVASGLAGGLADQRWLRWVQLVAGAGLLGWAVLWTRRPDTGSPGRLRRWRERVSADSSARGLVGLALVVTVIELAMMLPYLAAVGTISATDGSWPTRVLLLAAYCLVMVLPALVLTAARVAARRRLDPLLVRVDGWITRAAGETTAWVVGIVGFLLLGDAYQALS
ncbi:GAP family protein [Aeromicrobium sp. Root495]|uniref:GAP family protein n=1 Tax=Aeromicrobium sp. Root495 TaxID=1736550 RepID=UPI000A897815|nr:GAP family protein [Aeromicrobium sp. Root495]